MSGSADDTCTYCGTGGDELDVARLSVFADEFFPEDTSWSVVRPGVPACCLCARDVRQVQLRWVERSADPLDVEIMTRRLVRALYRWETNEPLPMDAAIESAQLDHERPNEVLHAMVAQGLQRRELKPGIAYWFARAGDSDCGSVWYVAIWSRIFLFAKTLRR